jgi:hypothetical protein
LQATACIDENVEKAPSGAFFHVALPYAVTFKKLSSGGELLQHCPITLSIK